MPLPKNILMFGFEPRLTEEQRDYVNAIFDYRMVMVDAIAGSGKTTLAVACAKLLDNDLIYIFSPIQEGSMGYRPGSQTEKEQAYIAPLIGALLEINENPIQVVYNEDLFISQTNKKKGDTKKLLNDIWVYPRSHVFARGTNISGGKTVIIDEAQNFTRGELKKILTRIHDDCKVIVIGHSLQCDLENPEKSGFIPYIEHYKNEPYCKICSLTRNFRGELANHADKLKW